MTDPQEPQSTIFDPLSAVAYVLATYQDSDHTNRYGFIVTDQGFVIEESFPGMDTIDEILKSLPKATPVDLGLQGSEIGARTVARVVANNRAIEYRVKFSSES